MASFKMSPEVMSELVRVGIPLVVDLLERRAAKPISEIPDAELLVMLRDPNLITDTDDAIAEGRQRVRAAKLNTEALKEAASAPPLHAPETSFVQEVPDKFISEDEEIMPQDFPE